MRPAETAARRDLVEALARALEERGYDLSVAESCTGGGLGAVITDMAGASQFFVGGVIAYSNGLKERLLGVSPDTLRQYGAVSEATVRAMAEGVKARLGTAVGIGITGIAGPTGGSADKPVGLVYCAVATPSGTIMRRDLWAGGRGEVRSASVRAALELALEATTGGA